MAIKKITDLPIVTSVEDHDAFIVEKAGVGTVQIAFADINRLEGPPGPQGEQGVRGMDGSSPAINEVGNWEIDGVDTGISATGDEGPQGESAAYSIYPNELKDTVARNLGGFSTGDSLGGMTIGEILEKLLCQ